MLDAGATGVVPVAELDDARAIRRAEPSVLLAGERGGVAMDGFDLGNSPLPERVGSVRGKTVVITTTNGTRAVGAAQACAGGVLAMSLTNLHGVLAHLMRVGSDAVVVCSGTDGGRSVEDEFAAGMLAVELRERGWTVSERAAGVIDAFENLLLDAQGVLGTIRYSPHAKRLIELGFEQDVEFCSQVGVTGTVPTLRAGGDGDAVAGLMRFVAS